MMDFSDYNRISNILNHRILSKFIDNEFIGMLIERHEAVVWANKAASQMLGLGEDNASLGLQSPLSRTNPNVLTMLNADRVLSSLQENPINELKLTHRDGTALWLQFQKLEPDENIGGTLWILVDITNLKDRLAEASHFAFHDELTGLPNRRAFKATCQRLLESAGEERAKAALCYLDIDDFKRANDTLGHSAGDTILRMVSDRILNCLGENDSVFRIGGDEFAIILKHMSEHDKARRTLARILGEINSPIPLNDLNAITIGASIGATIVDLESYKMIDIVNMADIAMYKAKSMGKNRIYIHE